MPHPPFELGTREDIHHLIAYNPAGFVVLTFCYYNMNTDNPIRAFDDLECEYCSICSDPKFLSVIF